MTKGKANARFLIIVAVLSVILFKFQNCGPVPQSNLEAGDAEVGLIDGWTGPGKVSFVESPQVLVGLNQPVTVSGVCASVSINENIVVELVDPNNPREPLEMQEVSCQSGSFQFVSASLTSNSCENYWIVRASALDDPEHVALSEVRVSCAE